MNEAKWMHLTVLRLAGNRFFRRSWRLDWRLERRLDLEEFEVRSWSWKWGWGANRKENKTQKGERREGQRIDTPRCCELGNCSKLRCNFCRYLCSHTLWFMGILVSAGLHAAPATSLHRLKIGKCWRHCTNCSSCLITMCGRAEWQADRVSGLCVGWPPFDRWPNE